MPMKQNYPHHSFLATLARVGSIVSIFAMSGCGGPVAHHGLALYPPDDIKQDIVRLDRVVRDHGFLPILLPDENFKSKPEGGIDWSYVANYAWANRKSLKLTVAEEIHGYGLRVNIVEYDDYQFEGTECDFVKAVDRAIRDEFGPKLTHNEPVFCNRFVSPP
jgi:hypothetical protein